MDSSPLVGPMGISGAFAPADFGDADDMRPTEAYLDIGGHGSPLPYTTAVNAMLQKHIEEIRGKASASLNLRTVWRKRLREFLSLKNTDLLDFLTVSVSSHPTFGKGDVLLRRFGNPAVHTGHPSVRDYVMDASGADILADISQAFENLRGEGGLKDYTNQTELLFNEYKMAGEEILKAQAGLAAKLEKLDQVQRRLAPIVDIETNEKYEPLLEATEGYLKKVFEECEIESDYKALVEGYRKFAVLRDVVLGARTILAQESEPLCSVCLNETVSYALTPCGHTFCQMCSKRQHGSCFMCRTAIKEKVKIYFG